eukprot:403340027
MADNIQLDLQINDILRRVEQQNQILNLNNDGGAPRMSQIRLGWNNQRQLCWNFTGFHIISFLRVAFFIVLLNYITNIEVKSAASVNEKNWTMTTLAIIISFLILVWILQCVVQYQHSNAFQPKLLYLFIYFLVVGAGEFIDHFEKGFSLNFYLQGEDAKIDSNFIHYVRMFFLIVVGFIAMSLIILLTAICCYARIQGINAPQRNQDLISKIKHVPYSSLFFEEGRDCSICLSTFENDDLVSQLQCSQYHVFHQQCLGDWIKNGKSSCPILANSKWKKEGLTDFTMRVTAREVILLQFKKESAIQSKQRLSGLLYFLKLVEVENKESEHEKQWIIEVVFTMLIAYTHNSIVGISSWLCCKRMHFMHLSYTLLSYASSSAMIGYQAYRSYNELDEDMIGHDKTYQDAIIHEAFLVLRFISLGIAIILAISIVAVIAFIFQAKRHNQLSQLKRDQYEQIESKRQKQAFVNTQMEINNKGRTAKRLFGLPHREMIINDKKQCGICFYELQNQNAVIQLSCNDNHIYHLDCMAIWLSSSLTYCPKCHHPIQIQPANQI